MYICVYICIYLFFCSDGFFVWIVCTIAGFCFSFKNANQNETSGCKAKGYYSLVDTMVW